jgi:hypothetical protein
MTQRDTAKRDRMSGLLRAALVLALAFGSTGCAAGGAGGALSSALGAPKAPSGIGKIIGQSGKDKVPQAKAPAGGKSPVTGFGQLVRDNNPLLDMVDPKNPTFNGRRGSMTFPAEDAMAARDAEVDGDMLVGDD